MSVHGAYKTLMMESKAMSKEDVILQNMLSEWIWEYVLKHCPNSDFIRALAQAYPLPDNSLHLKRLLLLKSLFFDLKESKFTDRTLEIVSALLSHYGPHHHRPHESFITFTSADGKKTEAPFSIQDLYLAVRVECTIQYLRDDMDDWPRFYAALGKHWADFAEDTQEPECVDAEKFSELKDELWAVQKQPELRHDLLKRHKREFVIRMMQCFLSDAWEDIGLVFLEHVAQNVEKGAYVPDGFLRNDDALIVPEKASSSKNSKERVFTEDGVRKEPLVPPGSSSERSANVDVGEDSRWAYKAGTEILIDTSTVLNSATRVLMSLPESAVDASAMEGLNERPSPRASKSNLNLPLGPLPVTATDTTVLKDPETLNAQDVWQSRRRIPTTLQEKHHKLESVKLVQGRVLRSSNSFGEGNPALVDLSSACGQMPLTKGARSTVVGVTLPATAAEQRDGEVEPIHLSPPPWAGSPAVSGTFNLSNKRQKRGLQSDTITPVGAVETPEIIRAQVELRQGQAHLSAIVQDPLPNAFKIAEEAVRSSREQKKIADQGMERGSGHTNNLGPGRSPHVEEATTPGPQGKPNKRSIMDRNPTAHTMQWETSDDIANSSDDDSPSRSKQIRLPQLRTQRSSRGISASHRQPKRRAMRRWTQEEESVLRNEVQRYGKGHWKHILQKHNNLFEGRTEVDLKDKWRNIERREGIL